MSEVRIAAEHRTEFGKGAARRIRRDRRVPAVLFGHGEQARHISLPGHELMLALKTANALLTIELDGRSELAIPKEVQRDVIKGFLEHVDLLLVRRGEQVTVSVAIQVEGAPAPGATVSQDLTEIQVLTDATAIPEQIVVDVSGLRPGKHITASALPLPKGTTLVTEPEALVLGIVGEQTAEQAEAELTQAESDAGIVHEAKSEDSE